MEISICTVNMSSYKTGLEQLYFWNRLVWQSAKGRPVLVELIELSTIIKMIAKNFCLLKTVAVVFRQIILHSLYLNEYKTYINTFLLQISNIVNSGSILEFV